MIFHFFGPFLSEHPILEPLRARWVAQRQQLAYNSAQNERKAIDEVKDAFAKIRRDLQDCNDDAIQSKIKQTILQLSRNG
jgi:hypothetical protein